MSLGNAKLWNMAKTRGKPSLPDDVFERFRAKFDPYMRAAPHGIVSEVAAALNVSAAAVSQWRTGKNRPTAHNVVAALRFLKCSDDEIATVLGTDPRFFATPEGPRNLANALGIPESLVLTLWVDATIGEEIMRYEEKFRRAALALMHSEGCTLQEAMGAITEARDALARNNDSGSWGALKWAEVATGFVKKKSQSGERPSWRGRASGEG